jgi:F-type H+-transporting ATPase subunit alpha
VGGNAQIKSMKKVAGTLKLSQAEFRELEAFSKFGSDLDAATKSVLEKGSRNVEILKQGSASPMRVEEQIAILYCGTRGLLMDVPKEKIKDFEKEYLHLLATNYSGTLLQLSKGELNDEITQTLELAAKKTIQNFVF